MGDMECVWVVDKEMRWVDKKEKKSEWKKRPQIEWGFIMSTFFLNFAIQLLQEEGWHLLLQEL